MNAFNVKKYGPVLVVGAVVGVGLSVVDPLGIKDFKRSLWLRDFHASPWKMALVCGILALLIYLYCEMTNKNMSESFAEGHLPANYYAAYGSPPSWWKMWT